jgi:hypothetical protein
MLIFSTRPFFPSIFLISLSLRPSSSLSSLRLPHSFLTFRAPSIAFHLLICLALMQNPSLSSPFPCLRSFPTWLTKKKKLWSRTRCNLKNVRRRDCPDLRSIPFTFPQKMSSLPFFWIMQPSQTWLAKQVTRLWCPSTWADEGCAGSLTRGSKGSQKVDFIKAGVSWYCTALHLEQMVTAYREVWITNMAYRSKLN